VLPLLTQTSIGDCINQVELQDKWQPSKVDRDNQIDDNDNTSLSRPDKPATRWAASATVESRTKDVVVSFSPIGGDPIIDVLSADVKHTLKIK
ncbi:hypothetical protein SARC_15378, partial [Sphaeroforma arctica JP610]